MKYLIFLSAILTLTSSIAQDKSKEFEFGFGGAANYSFFSMSGSPGKQIGLPGFIAGFAFNYTYQKNFSLPARSGQNSGTL